MTTSIYSATNMKEFFSSIEQHPYFAGLNWKVVSYETRSTFYNALAKRAASIKRYPPKMGRNCPDVFFKCLRDIHKKTERQYEVPSRKWLEKNLNLNYFMSSNIGQIINILSTNPRYADFFLNNSIQLLPERSNSRNPLIILFSLLSGGNPDNINTQGAPILSEIILEYEGEETEDLIKILLLAGANPNASDTTFGETALHCAVYIHNRTIIHTLLNHHANPNIESRRGQTAIDAAKISSCFSHINLRKSPSSVKDSFEERPIEEFKTYCNTIEKDLQASQTVYSIVKQFETTRSIDDITYLFNIAYDSQL